MNFLAPKVLIPEDPLVAKLIVNLIPEDLLGMALQYRPPLVVLDTPNEFWIPRERDGVSSATLVNTRARTLHPVHELEKFFPILRRVDCDRLTPNSLDLMTRQHPHTS